MTLEVMMEKQIQLLSVNMSEKKGFVKKSVEYIELNDKVINVTVINLIDCDSHSNYFCSNYNSKLISELETFFSSNNVKYKMSQKRVANNKDLLIQSMKEEISDLNDIVIICNCCISTNEDDEIQHINNYHIAIIEENFALQNLIIDDKKLNIMPDNCTFGSINNTLVLNLDYSHGSEPKNLIQVFGQLLPGLDLLNRIQLLNDCFPQ